MRPRDIGEGRRIATALNNCAAEYGELIGISEPSAANALVEQIVESQRRNRYVEYLRRKADLAASSADPHSGNFDPIRAAIIHHRAGQVDEAFWMVFLYTHFGKHRRSEFGYAADVYGRLGETPIWTWEHVTAGVSEFRQWLAGAAPTIRSRHRPGGFGNHRKYESLDAWSVGGTGAVIESYVDWVGEEGHAARVAAVTGDRLGRGGFDALYDSLAEVRRFGRTARFDWLTMARKIGLLEAVPQHAHLRGATGPKRGVILLSTGSPDSKLSVREQEVVVARLEGALHVGYDVLEDAICNWQKSPFEFKPFRG